MNKSNAKKSAKKLSLKELVKMKGAGPGKLANCTGHAGDQRAKAGK